MNTTLYIIIGVVTLFAIGTLTLKPKKQKNLNKTRYDATDFMLWVAEHSDAYQAKVTLVNAEELIYELKFVDITEQSLRMYYVPQSETQPHMRNRYYFVNKKDMYKAKVMRSTSPSS